MKKKFKPYNKLILSTFVLSLVLFGMDVATAAPTASETVPAIVCDWFF